MGLQQGQLAKMPVFETCVQAATWRRVWADVGAVMKKTVEQRGLAQQTLGYTAYGYLLARSGPVLGFSGERSDGVVQGYALGNGHRFYGPALMRFLSPDRLSPFGRGGVNAYCYCEGDPINNVDPSGRMFKSLRGGPMKLSNSVAPSPAKTLEHLPNELIQKIVDFLPVESALAFSKTSHRMRDITRDVTAAQSQHFNEVDVRPWSLEQVSRIERIAQGVDKIPARLLPGSTIKKKDFDQANQIRIDIQSAETQAHAMRGPLPWPFSWIRLE